MGLRVIQAFIVLLCLVALLRIQGLEGDQSPIAIGPLQGDLLSTRQENKESKTKQNKNKNNEKNLNRCGVGKNERMHYL